MAKYSIVPNFFVKHPKQYTLIDGERVALHLKSGTETLEIPGVRRRPPQTVTARAVTQEDLERLYHDGAPYIIIEAEKATKKPAKPITAETADENGDN